jgi:hypothetical protein
MVAAISEASSAASSVLVACYEIMAAKPRLFLCLILPTFLADHGMIYDRFKIKDGG